MKKKIGILLLAIILIDQWSKIYVKTHFFLGESYHILNWFQILFVENEGAAWGLKLPGVWGKLLLTIFRIVAVCMIGYWLLQLINKKNSKLLIYSVTLVLAGAFGNILDSIFYGIIFNESHFEVATIFSKEPYASLFYGKVVDMFSFPIIDTIWPSWVPFFGGKPFKFFEYVFNVSDISISFGGLGLFLALQRQNKNKSKKESFWCSLKR